MKRPMLFFAPDDPAGGAPEPEIDPLGEAPSLEAPTESTAPPTFDPNAFATQFGESFAKTVAKQPQAAAPEKPLTDEERKRLLNVWEPDDAFVQELGNLETQKSALAKQRDGLLKQFDTVTQIRLRELHEQITKQYDPIVQQFQAYEARERQNRFNAAYPDFAVPELAPVIGAVAQQLTSEGKTFTSEADLFKEVGTRLAAIAKVSNPNFQLSPASAGAKQKSSSIPVTTPGASGGGGNAKAQHKSLLLDVLGPLD